MAGSINAFIMGGCLLHGPLNPCARDGTRFTYPKYGPVPGVYTFGEMIQAIQILRGERDVPPEIRPLCNMRPNFKAVPGAAEFSDVDVALLEPSSPIEIIFRGCHLNRTCLAQQVMHPIRDLGRDAAKSLSTWFRAGLMAPDEEVRALAAEELVTFVPDDMADAEWKKAVIREARSERSNVLEGFRRVQGMIGRPLGVVVYIFQYLADGRALSWPAGFHEDVKEASRQLNLPVFEPSIMVNNYGVQAALRKDLRHYNDAFTPIMADALVEFAKSVFEMSRARAA
ncbi:MAG: hypothetical protein H0X27_05305 [Caulobacteraceae bacterium]|nr:hypothetical protein [Caulobacteraceae bacterium]